MTLDRLVAAPPRGTQRIQSQRALSPLNRALLVTDGTLTDVVEAWFLEPVVLGRIWQRRKAAGGAGLPIGPVIDRWIVMRGARTGRLRFVARSQVAIGAVPAEFVCDLDAEQFRLGDILRRHTPGVVRELQGAGVRQHLPGRIPESSESPAWIERRYRILRGSLPLATIREYLPEKARVLIDA